MRARAWILVVCLLGCVPLFAEHSDAKVGRPSDDTKSEIEKLASDVFATRKAATENLTNGKNVSALDLAVAVHHHTDLEVRFRARDILKQRFRAATGRQLPLDYFACALIDRLNEQKKEVVTRLEPRVRLLKSFLATPRELNLLIAETKQKKEPTDLGTRLEAKGYTLSDPQYLKDIGEVRFLLLAPDLSFNFVYVNRKGEIRFVDNPQNGNTLTLPQMPDRFLVGRLTRTNLVTLPVPAYRRHLFRRTPPVVDYEAGAGSVAGRSPIEVTENVLTQLGLQAIDARRTVQRALLQICPRFAGGN